MYSQGLNDWWIKKKVIHNSFHIKNVIFFMLTDFNIGTLLSSSFQL